MIYRIRLFLCHWFSHHDLELVMKNYKGVYELHKCKVCHLPAAVHWHTRKVEFLSWR